MPNINRSDAQQRADEIGVFNRELARLEAEQVLSLSDSQRAAAYDQGAIARRGMLDESGGVPILRGLDASVSPFLPGMIWVGGQMTAFFFREKCPQPWS